MSDEKMKLTVEIPKPLWRAAKIRAVETDSDLRSVVIEALTALLARPPKKGGSK